MAVPQTVLTSPSGATPTGDGGPDFERGGHAVAPEV